MRKPLLVIALCFLITSIALAQNEHTTKPSPIKTAPTTCGADPVLSSDGTDSPQDGIGQGSLAFFTVNAKAGHSYAVEVWDTTDMTAAVSPTIQLLASDCNTPVASTPVTNVDPDLSGGFSARASWIQESDATLYIQVTNPDQINAYTYQIRVTDTTLFNPRWTTYSGYETSWGLTNTTSTSINGTLTVFDVSGTVLQTLPETIGANLAVFVFATQKGVPTNHAGSATFAYVGPPGSILGDSYYLKPGITVPSFFVAKHAYH